MQLLLPSCDDCVVNGIVQRRSTDGGRSWGSYTWAVSDHSTDPTRPHMDIGGNASARAILITARLPGVFLRNCSWLQPSAVLDKATGKLILQFVRGLLDKKSEAQTCNPATTNWQQESTDGGLTWSKPVEISKYLGKWAGIFLQFYPISLHFALFCSLFTL